MSDVLGDLAVNGDVLMVPGLRKDELARLLMNRGKGGVGYFKCQWK